jgi:hypothetical protein
MRGGQVMAEVFKKNIYDELGALFVADVLSGDKAVKFAAEGFLADRLADYASYRMENAKTAGDALLVNDLLTAAKIVRQVAS